MHARSFSRLFVTLLHIEHTCHGLTCKNGSERAVKITNTVPSAVSDVITFCPSIFYTDTPLRHALQNPGSFIRICLIETM